MIGAAVYKKKGGKRVYAEYHGYDRIGIFQECQFTIMNIIDIIEIMLIAFFVYQFMVWIKFTRAYTLLKGLLVVALFLYLRIYLR